jgi:hypothetical protein
VLVLAYRVPGENLSPLPVYLSADWEGREKTVEQLEFRILQKKLCTVEICLPLRS